MEALRIAPEGRKITSKFCSWCSVDDGAHGLVDGRIRIFSTNKPLIRW